MTSWHSLILLAGAAMPSLVISWLATFLVRRWSPRWGLIDRPAARKVHTNPTPLGGGIAIWLGIALPLIAGVVLVTLIKLKYFAEDMLPEIAKTHLSGVVSQSWKLVSLLVASSVLLLLGLGDDQRALPWRFRLGVQVVVASLCVFFIDDLRLTAFLPWPIATSALSVLWIVALINSFNMLDNMDGLSAGVATIASLMLAAILVFMPDPTTRQPQLFVAGLLMVMAGSLLGFLWHNRPPAKIFMGDAGSYVIGFLIAVATLLATYAGYKGENRHAILAPLCVLAIPLYDLVTVIAIRLANGKSPFHADKNHFSHRLVDLGLSKTQAVLTIYLASATCGLAGFLLHEVSTGGAVVVMLMIGCVLSVIAIIETAARKKVRIEAGNPLESGK